MLFQQNHWQKYQITLFGVICKMATTVLKAFSNSVFISSVFFFSLPILNHFCICYQTDALLLPNNKELLPNYHYPLINFVNIKMLVVVLIVIVIDFSSETTLCCFHSGPHIIWPLTQKWHKQREQTQEGTQTKRSTDPGNMMCVVGNFSWRAKATRGSPAL